MKRPVRVLILEDSESDALLSIHEVKKTGLTVEWMRVDNRNEFHAALKTYDADIILADFSLPGFDGRTALHDVRALGVDIPFVFVTGTLGEELAIEMLKEGATDYVLKDGLGRLGPAFQRALRERDERRRRAAAERAHNESLHRYRQVVENASDVIFTVDKEGCFTYANEAAIKVSGYSMGELWKKNYLDLIPDPHKNRVRFHYMRQVLSHHLTSHIEFPFRAKSGMIVWFSQNASLILNEGIFDGFQAIAHDITERKASEEQLLHFSEQLRALATRLQSVKEDEQTRIAREIHDELGQALTGLKMDLSWIEKRVQAGTPEVLGEKIRQMFDLIDDTVRAIRRISSELRPGLLDDLGLVAALEWQLGEFSERTGIKGSFKTESDSLELDRERSTALFRIVQEALTNVVRHSSATRVGVTLLRNPHQLELRIEDNGRGITEDEIQHSSSLGILGMRERALVFNGHIDFRGRPGKGTTVVVSMPLNSAGAKRGDSAQGSTHG